MSTAEKTVDLDAGLDPNYTESDPEYTDNMKEYDLMSIADSTITRLIGYCGRKRLIEKQKKIRIKTDLKN